jgi:quinoprotein glucose dehydrogenase
MGLLGCADLAMLRDLVHDTSAGARMAAVLVERRLRRPEVAAFLDDRDPAIVLEAARAINDEPIPGALPQLAALAGPDGKLKSHSQSAPLMTTASAKKTSADAPDLFAPLLRRVINANFRLGGPANATALAALAANTHPPEALRAEALAALGDWPRPSGRDRITGLWRPLPERDGSAAAAALRPVVAGLLRSTSTPVKLAAIRVSARLGLQDGSPTVFDLVADTKQPADVRAEALRALASLKDGKLAAAARIAAADTDEALRKEATRVQAHLQPDDATANLKATLEKGSTGEKQNALATLGSVPGAAADDVLSNWMDQLLAKQVPAELQLDLLDAAAKRTAPALKAKLQQFEAARPADDELRAYRECLAGGNAEEGKKVFLERQDVACIRCHKINGEGGEVGPDLTGIATRKNREYILESILFPNKQIAAGFESLIVTMKNGTAYAGVFKSETPTVLEINSPEDGLLKLNKADVKMRERGLSAMPEELRQVLTKQDLRNLVEFLGSSK